MKLKNKRFYRLVSGIAALAFAAIAVAPALMGSTVFAASLTSLSLTMSDSTPSGVSGNPVSGIGSGTGVSYQFQFTTVSASQSLVIDFCSNSPFINTSCTAPTGLVTTGATASTVSGGGAMGGWTITTPTASQVKLSGSSSQAAGIQTFNVNGITNPSTVGGFYARIYTYSNATFGTPTTYSSATAVGSYVDYGAFAVSTTSAVSITANVMPTLQFCVLSAVPTASCANAGANLPNIQLGSGTPTALSFTSVSTTPVYSQLSTNASHGAIITASISTSCGGLQIAGGSTCIPAVGGTTVSGGQTITAGTAAFGLNVNTGAPVGGGTGSTTPASPYASAGQYGMDTTDSGNSVTGTYGSKVASTNAPTANVNNTYTFAATASATTPSGVYSAFMSFVATGTF